MVRYARAVGSMGSSKRVPYEATPWSEMLAQMRNSRVEMNPKNGDRTDDDYFSRKKRKAYVRNADAAVTIDGVYGSSRGEGTLKKKKRESASEGESYSAENDYVGESFMSDNNKKKQNEIQRKKKRKKTPHTEIVSEGHQNKKQDLGSPQGSLDSAISQSKQQDLGSPVNKDPVKKKKKKKSEIMSDGKNSDKQIKKGKIKAQKTVQKDKFLIESSSYEDAAREYKDMSSRRHTFTEQMMQSSGSDSVQDARNITIGNQRNPKKHCGVMKDTGAAVTVSDKADKWDMFGSSSVSHRYLSKVTLIDTVQFDGFNVKREDAIQLEKLRQKLKRDNVPWEKIKEVLKRERRNAEKHLQRENRKMCFRCRKPDHAMSECPEMEEQQDTHTGICFICGSTEHLSHSCKVRVRDSDQFRFARCFICGEQGHLSKQCLNNPHGVYPLGGTCRICGDVTHFGKDCPEEHKTEKPSVITVGRLGTGRGIEALDGECPAAEPTEPIVKKKVRKIVKF